MNKIQQTIIFLIIIFSCFQLQGITTATEPGVVHFKVETLHCRVCLNPHNLQSLHIKVTCLPELKDQWTLEELQVSFSTFSVLLLILCKRLVVVFLYLLN